MDLYVKIGVKKNYFDTTNFNTINWYEKKYIKNKINNIDFINSLTVFPKNNIILDLEKHYNNDIVTILLCTKSSLINTIDIRYFIPCNLIDLINNVNIFHEKRIIKIISNLLLKYSEIIKKIMLYEFTLLYKINKNIRQIYVIDYIINYLEIVDEFKKNTGYKQLFDICNKKPKINFLNINCNIDSNLDFYLNTSNSLIIKWIIKNFSRKKIFNNLKKCLNEKKCLIKESDMINILKLYLNSEGFISKNIWLYTIIPEKLLTHKYLYAFKLFEKYYKNNNIKYSNKITGIIIGYIKESNTEELDILLKHEYIHTMILQNYIVLDFIICSIKYIDNFIKIGFKLPVDYLNKLLKSQYFNKYSRIKKINKNINKYLKQDLNTTLKNIYNNLIKLNIPLNDLIISHFINIIPEEKIINFYNKTSDIDELIPCIIYKKKYSLLDKLFESKIILLEHYKNKFDFYIKKIYKNKYCSDELDILKIYKYNQQKYSIIPFNKIIKIGLKIRSLDEIKKIFKLYKNIVIKIDFKIVLNKLLDNNFYPFYISKKKDSLIKILEYLKPFIKNYKYIFDNQTNINKIIGNSVELTLYEIKKIKEYKPDYKLNLELINCTSYRDLNNLLEIVEYILKEFNNKNITEKIKVSPMYNKFFKNFLQYFDFSENNIKKIILLSNKYLSFNNILNQKNLYELLHKYTFTLKKFILLEEANFFKFDIYTNIYIICHLDNNKLELLKYSIQKTPYLKYKTYNYLKSFMEYYKLNVTRNEYKYSYYFYSKTYILFSYILKIIPENNIIYPNHSLYKYKPNRPDYIDDIKNDLVDILFCNFPQTNDNNILDEL